MDFLFLTKDSGWLAPISALLGNVLNLLFNFCYNIGLGNIGVVIILFTFITRIILIPFTIKQQKSSKLMAVMNPEIQAIQKKYKDNKDPAIMQKQNAEIQEVYKKYGTSPTGGCLPLLIQMPIMFALYRVVSNIPAYVDAVREPFQAISGKIMESDNWQAIINKIIETEKIQGIKEIAVEVSSNNTEDKLSIIINNIIDVLYKFDGSAWDSLKSSFPQYATEIGNNLASIENMNYFLGLSLMEAPGFRLSPAIIIPILSALTQWFSVKLSMANQPMQSNEENPAASSMKTMNNVMPLMSAFFCISMPSAVGLYWIAGSVFQIVQQLIVNSYMNKVDINEMVAKSVEKANKKREKQGKSPYSLNKLSTINATSLKELEETKKNNEENKKSKIEEHTKKSTDYYKKGVKDPNSLAAKAAMVKKYNEKNEKGNKNNKEK